MTEYLIIGGVLLLGLVLLAGAAVALPIVFYRAGKLWAYGQLKARQEFELRNKPTNHTKETIP